MSNATEFRADVYQNPYLAKDGREVHAVLTLQARSGTGASPRAPQPERAEVLIIDCSGSMEMPRQKLERAKEAAAAAIDQLRDGVFFAVVAGSDTATMVWPPEPKLVPTDVASRADAKAALSGLRAGGGTAISSWLAQARRLFADCPGAVKHAILLTDGRNEHETPNQLADVLVTCDGHFTCDCRGVGDDWIVDELRTISSTLLGTLGMVAEPEGLAEDFRAMMADAMEKAVANVALRVWTPQDARVVFLKQVVPSIEDLTSRRVDSGTRTGDYPTGSWATESRDYHISIEVPAGAVGEEMLAARLTIVHQRPSGEEEMPAQQFLHPSPDGTVTVKDHGLVRAVWTADAARATEIEEHVARATGQVELGSTIQRALGAYESGEYERARLGFEEARAMARERGDEMKVQQIDSLVDYDPDTDTVQLKAEMKRRDIMKLDVDSHKTEPRRRV